MHLTLLEARNLTSSTIRAVVDPYCIISCGPNFKYTSTIKRHTMNPVWNEAMVFTLLDKQSVLKISLYNHDPLSLGECIGEVDMPLKDFMNGESVTLSLKLLCRKHGMNRLGNAMKSKFTKSNNQSVSNKLTGECDIANATGQQRSGGTPPPPRRLEKTHHYASAEIGIELRWIDTRFPTRIRVLLGEGTTAEKSKVLSRRFCEKRLCVGIDPTDACDTKYNRRRE